MEVVPGEDDHGENTDNDEADNEEIPDADDEKQSPKPKIKQFAYTITLALTGKPKRSYNTRHHRRSSRKFAEYPASHQYLI